MNTEAMSRQQEAWYRLQAGAQSAPALTAAQEQKRALGSANAAHLAAFNTGMANAAAYSPLSEQILPTKKKTWLQRFVDRFR